MLVLLSTVLGFSFAMHVLGLTTLPEGDASYVNGTIYEVFAATLGIGSFFEKTIDMEYYAYGGRLSLFQLVFAVYVTFTGIILVNMLIAMMNSRYDRAKTSAENVWRLEMVASLQWAYGSVAYKFFKYVWCRIEGFEMTKEDGRIYMTTGLRGRCLYSWYFAVIIIATIMVFAGVISYSI